MAENILLVIEGTYPWYRGGVSEWTYQYLRSCKTINFSILQIATDEFQGLDPHKALYPLTDNIVDFTRISPPNMSNSWEEDSIEWYASISDKLQELAQFSSCIHVTNTGFAGWLGAEIATKMDKPLVLTEHAIYWEEIKKGAVALECGYKIPDTLSAKNHVVQTFINIAKRVYSVSDKVISVEFIAEFKTLDLNPQFVMMLSDANEKVLEDEVRELAEKHTDIDMIWNQSAIEHMHRLDMLCITSHNESQPLVLFEALANMALPIGWEVGDVDSEFAFVVQDDITSKQFAQEVESLWNNRTLFNEMVEERHQKVKEEHNWTTIFDKYQDIFSKNNLIRLQANL